MYRIIIKLCLVSIMAMLAGCVINNFDVAQPVASGVTLKSENLYIYSFLDLRASAFGPTTLEEFNKQLLQQLNASSVTAKVLNFKDSDVGHSYIATNSGMYIPIGQTIKDNLQDEKTFGARYRLVIFPTEVDFRGAWKFFDLRWVLYDTQTNKVVWETISHGKKNDFWSTNEDPQNRGGILAKGIMDALRKSNLI